MNTNARSASEMTYRQAMRLANTIDQSAGWAVCGIEPAHPERYTWTRRGELTYASAREWKGSNDATHLVVVRRGAGTEAGDVQPITCPADWARLQAGR